MILVTGSAGFIGFHLARRLATEGRAVVGVDNLNDYYDVALKEARNQVLGATPNFRFVKADLADAAALERVFAEAKPRLVIHMAAQAGVRHSLTNPRAYAESNLSGFLNLLECCRHARVEHLIYASSSSVYGLNTTLPFSVHQHTNHPVSFYAATKKANELMAHSYSHLFGIPTTGLRLFTVYGPWGRPDMALFTFTKAILSGAPIEIFGDGRMQRDFTFVDDVVEAVVRLLGNPPAPNPAWDPARPDPASSSAPYRLLNVGNRSPVEVLQLIETLEAALGRKADRRFSKAQACEVQAAIADASDLERVAGYVPTTPLADGIRRFVQWYREHYKA
jgi:UDP-glucuronate 4-epimerase